jgi:hypothetical protein
MELIAAIISIISGLFGFLGSSSDDSSDIAGAASGEDGWLTTFANGVSGSFDAIGTGLSESGLTTQDVVEFTALKEIGAFSSIGIGDSGPAGAAADGLESLLEKPWFIPAALGFGAFLLYRSTS